MNQIRQPSNNCVCKWFDCFAKTDCIDLIIRHNKVIYYVPKQYLNITKKEKRVSWLLIDEKMKNW